MRRTQTVILFLLTAIVLSVLAYIVITTLHGTLGRFFMTLLNLRLTLNGVIWLIVGLVIGYFIGFINTHKK